MPDWQESGSPAGRNNREQSVINDWKGGLQGPQSLRRRSAESAEHWGRGRSRSGLLGINKRLGEAAHHRYELVFRGPVPDLSISSLTAKIWLCWKEPANQRGNILVSSGPSFRREFSELGLLCRSFQLEPYWCWSYWNISHLHHV